MDNKSQQKCESELCEVKKKIFNSINNKDNSLAKLSDRKEGIKIENYVGVKLASDEEKTLAYGVNVRLSKDATTKLLPFFYCNHEKFDSNAVVRELQLDGMIPSFLKEFGIKEAFFKTEFEAKSNTEDVEIIKIIKIKIQLPDETETRKFEDFIKNNPLAKKTEKVSDEECATSLKNFEKFFTNKNSFLSENIKGLMKAGMDSKTKEVFVWVRGEDPSMLSEMGAKNDEVGYLTNIFAISTDVNLIKELRTKMDEIWEFVMLLKSRKMDDYSIAQIKESIKSVIAALMARNMSHNLGSHPLTNTKNYFRKRIEEVTSSQTKPTRTSLGADYRGNVHLLQYIKERMDFIATVVSGDQYPFGALNFKAQLFDVLTEDDHGARHDKTTQNFLLKYLVFSEKLTRNDKKCKPEGYCYIKLRVIYETKEYCAVPAYTGTTDKERIEEYVKLILSQLELAVPGGLMGRHAFFCIIENIIRNSAKHSKKDEDLEITIKLELNDDKRTMDISIYDNRESGEEVMRNIIDEHFKKLVILKEENNHIDKNSKGLKEMLICALWLRNENVAEKLYEIQSEKDGEKKLDHIKKYLDVTLVDKNGEKKENEGNLCYTIKNIPLFETCHQLEKGKDYDLQENNIIRLNAEKVVGIHADIVAADDDYQLEENYGGRKLSEIFPRFVDLSKFNEVEKEKWDEAYQAKNGEELFKMFDKTTSGPNLLEGKPTITIDSEKYSEKNIVGWDIEVRSGKIDDSDWTILFKTHFDNATKEKKQEIVGTNEENNKYLESESGENFTSTIATIDFLQEFVNRYKVVEAANTHIAIIDERIYGDFQTRWNGDVRLEQKLLEMRGIYLLNYENGKIIDLQGEEFVKNENINFVSIHLGLLDKKDHESELIKEVDATNPEGKGQKSSINIKENILKEYFDEKTFVSIHSGRGNFSADLEGELKNYPFISLSALEAAFYDCKYFLTQLFKTTNYYGKGNITDK